MMNSITIEKSIQTGIFLIISLLSDNILYHEMFIYLIYGVQQTKLLRKKVTILLEKIKRGENQNHINDVWH